MHPSSLLSYYPTYGILDEVLSYGDFKELNLYIDLKNCFQTLYQEHAIVNIIENSIRSQYIESSILVSLLSFLEFHKLYSIKRNIKINFYIFFESGISYYHQNISKEYKISRRIDDLYGLPIEKRELFQNTVRRNFEAIEKICNKIPNVTVVRLLNMEADFIPYFAISRKHVNTGRDTAHLVYSNDHDLLQTLTAGSNVYVFQKIVKTKRLVRSGEVMSRELKTETKLDDKLQPLAMSIIGDVGDDVHGVYGIAAGRFKTILNDLIKLIGSMENLLDNVSQGKPIFDLTKVKVPNKYLSKVISAEQKKQTISKNMRLVSFELISRVFESPSTTEMVNRRNNAIKLLTEGVAPAPLDKLKTALEMNRVFFGEELDNLFYGYSPP